MNQDTSHSGPNDRLERLERASFLNQRYQISFDEDDGDFSVKMHHLGNHPASHSPNHSPFDNHFNDNQDESLHAKKHPAPNPPVNHCDLVHKFSNVPSYDEDEKDTTKSRIRGPSHSTSRQPANILTAKPISQLQSPHHHHHSPSRSPPPIQEVTVQHGKDCIQGPPVELDKGFDAANLHSYIEPGICPPQASYGTFDDTQVGKHRLGTRLDSKTQRQISNSRQHQLQPPPTDSFDDNPSSKPPEQVDQLLNNLEQVGFPADSQPHGRL